MTPSNLTQEDIAYLDRARELGRRGWGRVQPNPLVGCVVVKDGRIVGEGHHAEYGGSHAEVSALSEAGERARGATVYVTLEPCRLQGKTPPCTRALIDGGVAKVVFAASEPGKDAGGGAEELRGAGIEVVGPTWTEREAVAENPAFFHRARHATPFVALKLAISLDGRIAAGVGERSRLTGEAAEREVHRLRTGFDAVLIGAGTSRTDDPRLTPRLVAPGRTALQRIVLDPRAGLASDAALFEELETSPLHVFVDESAPEVDMERLEALGAHVHPVRGRAAGLDLGHVLEDCAALGLDSILCEGGARLAGALAAGGHVQRLYLFVAPLTFGAAGVNAFGDSAGDLDWSGFEPALEPRLFGRDALLVYDRLEG